MAEFCSLVAVCRTRTLRFCLYLCNSSSAIPVCQKAQPHGPWIPIISKVQVSFHSSASAQGLPERTGQSGGSSWCNKVNFALSLRAFPNIWSIKRFTQGSGGSEWQSWGWNMEVLNPCVPLSLYVQRKRRLFSIKGTSSRSRASSFIINNAVSEE